MLPFFLVLATMSAELAAPTPEGNWRNPRGTVVMTIAPCGEALCGRVLWASDEAQADARRGGTDPLVGAELLSGFVTNGKGRWKGRLFVPDLNKRSKAELRPLGPDQVKVTGCAIGRMFCKSEVWTRTDAQSLDQANLPR
jgi:uncharacterized protein (DUF2147 family)